jgi:hypothetical protein
MTKTFGILDFCHLNLSLDFARDGERVEPFRISEFDIRIYQSNVNSRGL